MTSVDDEVPDIPSYLMSSNLEASWEKQQFKVTHAKVKQTVGPMKELFGEERHVPKEMNTLARRLDFMNSFASKHGLRHMLPNDYEITAVVDMVVNFLRWKIRNQRTAFLLRIRAIYCGVKNIARFQVFTKELREARISDIVHSWKALESSKREKCCRAAEHKNTETMMRLAQEYAAAFVPDELKYQAVKAVYWRRTLELHQSYRRWIVKYKRSREQYNQVRKAVEQARSASLLEATFMKDQPKMWDLAKRYMACTDDELYEDPGPRPVFRFNWECVTIPELLTAAGITKAQMQRPLVAAEDLGGATTQTLGSLRGSFHFPPKRGTGRRRSSLVSSSGSLLMSQPHPSPNLPRRRGSSLRLSDAGLPQELQKGRRASRRTSVSADPFDPSRRTSVSASDPFDLSPIRRGAPDTSTKVVITEQDGGLRDESPDGPLLRVYSKSSGDGESPDGHYRLRRGRGSESVSPNGPLLASRVKRASDVEARSPGGLLAEPAKAHSEFEGIDPNRPRSGTSSPNGPLLASRAKAEADSDGLLTSLTLHEGALHGTNSKSPNAKAVRYVASVSESDSDEQFMGTGTSAGVGTPASDATRRPIRPHAPAPRVPSTGQRAKRSPSPSVPALDGYQKPTISTTSLRVLKGSIRKVSPDPVRPTLQSGLEAQPPPGGETDPSSKGDPEHKSPLVPPKRKELPNPRVKAVENLNQLQLQGRSSFAEPRKDASFARRGVATTAPDPEDNPFAGVPALTERRHTLDFSISGSKFRAGLPRAPLSAEGDRKFEGAILSSSVSSRFPMRSPSVGNSPSRSMSFHSPSKTKTFGVSGSPGRSPGRSPRRSMSLAHAPSSPEAEPLCPLPSKKDAFE